eukprot:TRINITY_DN66723_c7_g5_i2.p1 TRINITY_DN66723_c7_g5~~TRINITY_DN66723_c7_g5_i2.p1  ORF type:complete len:397 (-),score=7.06 TRINITY_DN66723_c7_g5_i2:197-1387(-)
MSLPDNYPRRREPTFMLAADPPTSDETWQKLSFRDRIRAWNLEVAGNGNSLPYVTYVVVCIKVAIYLGVFEFGVRDRSQGYWAELNVKRFLLYNIIGDVLGFNSTNGALGFRFKTPFTTWYNFFTPGTLTCPLLPFLPGVRAWYHVVLFVVYLGSLFRALFSSSIGQPEILPCVVSIAILLLFDMTPYMASRAEHFVSMLFCLMFPGRQWLFGCQMVQVALWTGAGVAKWGPWFKYVIAQMTPNCQFLRVCPSFVKALFKDYPKDLNPSNLAFLIALKGCTVEVAMGWLCVYQPTAHLGVFITTLFHIYILSMLPFASVMEWNVFCINATWFLFYGNSVSVPDDLSPVLTTFLVVMLIVVPVFGQLFPRTSPETLKFVQIVRFVSDLKKHDFVLLC